MNAIIDSNVFIAAWHKRDQHNDASIDILNRFAAGKIRNLFITDYVLMEVVNFLIKKTNFTTTLAAYDYLTKSDRIKMMYVDRVMALEIKRLFSDYKALTLTDCSLIALSKELNIRTLFSFDTGFDRVKNVRREL